MGTLTLTMTIGDYLDLRRSPARTVITFERLKQSLVEESRLLLRSAIFLQVMNADVKAFPRERVNVSSCIALFPVVCEAAPC